MIIILKKGTSPDKVNEMINHFENMNFQVQEVRGVHETILGLIGDTSSLEDVYKRQSSLKSCKARSKSVLCSTVSENSLCSPGSWSISSMSISFLART